MANKNPRCPVCGHPLRPIQQGTPEKRYSLLQWLYILIPRQGLRFGPRKKQVHVTYLFCDSCEFEAPASRFAKKP